MNMEEGFQLKDLWPMVRRRMGLACAVAGAVTLMAVLLAAWLPNRYMAATTILVEPQAVSERLIESGLRESDLNTRLNIMTAQILSRPRLSRIIDDLGLYEEESREMTREEVIGLMRRQIDVAPVLPELQTGDPRKETEINTFQITYWSDSARTAAAVANRLANDFIEQHIRERVQLSGDTSEFIQAELERLSSRIREVESQIARVKEENAGSTPDELDNNQERLMRLNDRTRSIRSTLAQAQSDAAFYRQQAVVAADVPRVQDQDTNPIRRLDSLEIALGSYRAKGFTDKHPDVRATLQEIEEVKRLIAEESDAREEGEGPMNLAQRTAEAEARRAELRVESAQQELRELAEQEQEVIARIERTPRVAEQLSGLEREYLHLSAKVQEFSDKRLSASVAADVERRQKGEQFRVLESAVTPPEPASPNRPLILAMGVVLGLALGGMTGLLVESADTSFHGARQLQSALRIPVLAAIPNIRLEADRVAARRRALRRGIAVAGIVGVVLGTSAFGYWWNNLASSGEAAAEQPAAERARQEG